MPTLTYREALRQSIVEEIERDENVFLIGEDIGRYQGTFRVTQGLFERFKQKRPRGRTKSGQKSRTEVE